MLFKDIKQGYPIYIFDRNSVTVKTGNATAVSFPHISNKVNTGMVVDVTINIDGNSQQYEIKDTSECAYVGTIMLSPNIDSVLNEIRGLKAQSEEVVKSIDKHQDTINKCSALLTEFDPIFKEKQVNEERLSRIEKSIDKLTTVIENMTSRNI
jgi:hypothetical protein